MCHQRYLAIGGSVTPLDKNDDWHQLNDGDAMILGGYEPTMGITKNIPGGVMQLNFIKGGVKANRVRVVHRGVEMRRSNGITLEAIDPSGAVIFTYLFKDINIGSPLVDEFDMTGRKL